MSTLSSMKEAAKHSSSNRLEIEASSLCGCYCCESTYSASEVTEWTPKRGRLLESAICPKCGTDSVIGDASGVAINADMLKSMRNHYFNID